MSQNQFDQIMEFNKFLLKFQQIKRDLYVTGEDRMENDAEHSYQLTMMAWFINSIFKLNFNLDLLMRYALVHDLVEVWAGDTSVFNSSSKMLKDKKQREQKAFKIITKQFSHFPELTEYINLYSTQQDQESLFIYSLDKLLPALNIYFDNGRSWKEHNITLERWLIVQKAKICKDRTMEIVLKSFLELITNKNELFEVTE